MNNIVYKECFGCKTLSQECGLKQCEGCKKYFHIGSMNDGCHYGHDFYGCMTIRVIALEEELKRVREMVEALLYAPNGPMYQEAKEDIVELLEERI